MAVWRGEGSSFVAKIEVEVEDGGSSKGPSSSFWVSAMVVMGPWAWAKNGPRWGLEWADKKVGFWRRKRGEEDGLRRGGRERREGEERRWRDGSICRRGFQKGFSFREACMSSKYFYGFWYLFEDWIWKWEGEEALQWVKYLWDIVAIEVGSQFEGVSSFHQPQISG